MLGTTTVLRFIRYALVGLATNLVGYAVYLLVTYLGGGPKTTMTVLYIFGASLGYIGNRQWAFRHSGSIWHSSLKYLAFHAGGYLINYLMLSVLSDGMGFPHQLVQAAAVVVVAVYLFTAFNLFVFNADKADSAAR